MAARAGRVVSGGAIHLLARLLGLTAAVAVVPLLTRHLGAADYGRLATLLVVAGLAATVADAGLPLIAAREWPRLATEDRANWVRSFVTARATSSVAVATVLAVLALALPISGQFRFGVLWVALGVPGALATSASIALSTAALNPRSAATVEAAARLAWLTVVAVALVADLGSIGVIAGLALAHLVVGTLALRQSLGRVRAGPSLATRLPAVVSLLRRGAVLAIVPLLGLVFARADLLILAIRAPAFDVGVYGLIYRVIEVLVALVAVGGSLVTPIIAGASAGRASEFYNASLRVLLAGFLPLSVVLGFASSLVIRILGGTDFLRPIATATATVDARSTLLLLAVALPVMVTGIVNGSALVALNRERALVAIFAVLIPTNLGLTWWLTGRLSLFGAALATLVTELFAASLTTAVLRRALQDSRIAAPAAPAIIIAGAVGIVLTAIVYLPLLLALLAAGAVAGVTSSSRAVRLPLARALELLRTSDSGEDMSSESEAL